MSLSFALLLGSIIAAPPQKSQPVMRIIGGADLPLMGQPFAIDDLIYYTEQDGDVMGIDAKGTIQAKGSFKLSKQTHRVHGMFRAPKGDLYIVCQEMQPRGVVDQFEQYEPNAKFAVIRLSPNLKQKWSYTRILPKTSDIYGCAVDVDANGAVTVALGVTQQVFRVKSSGKLEWEAKLPIKNSVKGLHVDVSGTSHIALAPTLFEGDGVSTHRISVVSITPQGNVSEAKPVGETFTETYNRSQEGRFLYIDLSKENNHRITCLDLLKGVVQWDHSLREVPYLFQMRFAGAKNGEAAISLRENLKGRLVALNSKGEVRYNIERESPARNVKFLRDKLAIVYQVPKNENSISETKLDILDPNGKMLESFGLGVWAESVGVQMHEIGGAYVMSNLWLQHSYTGQKGGITTGAPILWTVHPPKR